MLPLAKVDPANASPFGKYLLLGPIGTGGMAEVFLARPHAQRRLVAIKVIRSTLMQEKQYVDMFIREGNLSVQLVHDAIVKTFEIGRIQGRHFICMEYISGIDLSLFMRRLRRTSKRLPVPYALSVALRVCEGLSFAHELKDEHGSPLNLVNRDVSPSNIRLSYEGDVKLLDFGIAKAISGLASEIGVLKGKVTYMSPEQVRGLPLDRRSDVFSTGIVLHEMLTQERLFRGETEFQMMDNVRRAEVPAPSSINSRVPPEVDRIALTALQKDPGSRYQTADEMATMLRGALANYNFQKTELRDFVREVCHEEWEAEQQTLARCLSMETPEPPATQKADEDYGEMLLEYEPPAPRVAPGPQRPTIAPWLWGLLGFAILLLFAAVALILHTRK